MFLFRKTSARKTASKKLKDLIQTLTNNHERKKDREIKSTETNENTQQEFKFAWWFKIVLYLISFVCMGVSIVLILFKGYLF